MTDAVKKHTVEVGWDRWQAEMLKNVVKAKPFEPEVVKTDKDKKSTKKSVVPTDAIAIVSDIEPLDLDDSEFELLQPK